MSDHRSAAISAALEKYLELLDVWAAAHNEAAALTARIASLDQTKTETSDKMADCYKFAALFDVDLDDEIQKHFDKLEKSNPHTGERPELPPAPSLEKPRTVREMVIDWARNAYPLPVKAADLRKQLEEAGHHLHEKTVGMTLYRLSKDGMLHRQGRDWFFVPEHERAEKGNSPEPQGPEELDLQP